MIKERLFEVNKIIDSRAKLVAVSKTKPNEDILKVYETGHKVFGENKALELRDKAEQLPKDIEWHFIGRLQTNKVKYVVKTANLIHSVDRVKLIEYINSEAKKINKIQDVLIQVNISEEESKTGFSKEEIRSLKPKLNEYSNIRVLGLMTMAPFLKDSEEVRWVFKEAKNIFESLKEDQNESFEMRYLSMGMSNDYEVAIQEGSNLVRVGSSIFGSRNYN